MLIRCSKESQHPAERTPGPPVEHQENEKDNVDGHKNGSQNISVLFGLQLPLTRKPWVTLFEPCNKVRGTYIYKEVLRVYLLLCRYDTAHNNTTLLHQLNYEGSLVNGSFKIKPLTSSFPFLVFIIASIMVVDVLMLCNTSLHAWFETRIYEVQHRLINCVKGESTVDHITVTRRFKKFHFSCKIDRQKKISWTWQKHLNLSNCIKCY